RLELAERLADRVPLGIVAAVVLIEAAGARNRIERGVRDEAVDRARDQELLASLHHCPVHAAAAHLRVEVARERVFGLVVMVVGVEDQERKVGHARGASRLGAWEGYSTQDGAGRARALERNG